MKRVNLFRQHSGHVFRLLFTLLLLAALPLFIWAVLTQRIELRKKAATSEPPVICWNRVGGQAGGYYWPNGCKGDPNPQMCTQATVQLSSSEVYNYLQWVNVGKPYIPGCGGPTPTCVPRPTCLDANPRCLMPEPINGWCVSDMPNPPPGCYYQQVQCIQAPCNPILVCPTPTPTPILGCNMREPTIFIVPQNQNGHPGDTLTYTVAVNNNDRNDSGSSCTNSTFIPSAQVSPGWTYNFSPSTLTIWPGQTLNTTLSVTSSTTAITNTASIPVSVLVKNDRSNLQARTDVAYTLVPNIPQTMKLRLKLAGVSDGSAEGAKVAVKFYKKDGTILQLSEPLTITHAGSGIYTTSAVITNPFAGGTQLRIKIKGEKHVSIEYCRQSGQISPCGDNDYITVPNPAPTDYIFDFTGIPLPPGDLAVQDGQANRADLDKLTALMSKLCENLTVAEKLIGDVDYNGCVNIRDVFFILHTLETRYDE